MTKTKLAAIVIYFLSASDVLLTGVTIWFSYPETYSQESWAHPRGCSSAPLLVQSHNRQTYKTMSFSYIGLYSLKESYDLICIEDVVTHFAMDDI